MENSITKRNGSVYLEAKRADIEAAEKALNELKSEYETASERINTPRHNRIMGYVIRACNELGVELQEVWCSSMKCVYRFPGESEDQARMFMYGSTADYEQILNVIRDEVGK